MQRRGRDGGKGRVLRYVVGGALGYVASGDGRGCLRGRGEDEVRLMGGVMY